MTSNLRLFTKALYGMHHVVRLAPSRTGALPPRPTRSQQVRHVTATFGLRAGQLRRYGMFSPRVEVSGDASDQTRMLALLGRVS